MSLQPQVTERDKQIEFVNSIRQWATTYRDTLALASDLVDKWNSLYTSEVEEQDCEAGTNIQIIPNVTRRASLVDVISNMQSILSTFDAGIDTNFERVTL